MLPGVRRPTSLDVSYVSVPANQANSFSSTITVKTLQVSRCDNNVGVFVSDQDTRLSLIATDQSYRQNFTAADDSRSTKMGTIHSIIDMIVRVSFGDRRKKVLYLTKWSNVSFLSIFSDKWDKGHGMCFRTFITLSIVLINIVIERAGMLM